MVSDVNVFGSLMKHRVVGDGYGTCVITIDGYHLILNVIVT